MAKAEGPVMEQRSPVHHRKLTSHKAQPVEDNRTNIGEYLGFGESYGAHSAQKLPQAHILPDNANSR